MKQKILDILEQNRGKSISGAQIAKSLNITRSAVWKQINNLKAQGFDISSSSGLGYRLAACDDTYSVFALKKYLDPDFNPEIFIYNTIDSTNNAAKKLAQQTQAKNMLIISNHQSAGRGRYLRAFHSPKDAGVYLSIVIKPDAAASTPLITCLAAVAVVKALKKLYNLRAKIKWVNDIYIDNKKICGILTEASINLETSVFDYIIVGIGINIAPPKQGYHKEIENTAASIAQYTNKRILKNQLVGEIANTIFDFKKIMENKEFMKYYKSKSMLINKQVYVIKNNESELVTVLDITDEGHLVVLNSNNEIKNLFSGEVSLKL